jgi:hypothetical protein
VRGQTFWSEFNVGGDEGAMPLDEGDAGHGHVAFITCIAGALNTL